VDIGQVEALLWEEDHQDHQDHLDLLEEGEILEDLEEGEIPEAASLSDENQKSLTELEAKPKGSSKNGTSTTA
jgi:hypothetical protein